MGTFTFEVDWKESRTALYACGGERGCVYVFGAGRGVYTSDDTSMPFRMEKNSLIQVVPNVRVSAYHR